MMSELTPKGTIKGSFTLISICFMAFAAELVDATIWKSKSSILIDYKNKYDFD